MKNIIITVIITTCVLVTAFFAWRQVVIERVVNQQGQVLGQIVQALQAKTLPTQ
jgi:hypothetical protein